MKVYVGGGFRSGFVVVPRRGSHIFSDLSRGRFHLVGFPLKIATDISVDGRILGTTTSIYAGRDGLKKKHGVSVRLFNSQKTRTSV